MNLAPETGSNPGYDEGVEGVVPTHENSTKKTAPALESGLNSPEKVGDASC